MASELPALAVSTSEEEEEDFEEIDISALCFTFRGEKVPVTVASTVSAAEAKMALECKQFAAWVARCEKTYSNKKFKMHSVEIQSVDPFGQRYVSNCSYSTCSVSHSSPLL